MSALTISAESPAGVLADGTPYYAPLGEVIVDGSLVTCHLCGRALRSVTAHLRSHGWAWRRSPPNAPSLRRGCGGRRGSGPRANRRTRCQTTFGRPPGPPVAPRPVARVPLRGRAQR